MSSELKRIEAEFLKELEVELGSRFTSRERTRRNGYSSEGGRITEVFLNEMQLEELPPLA